MSQTLEALRNENLEDLHVADLGSTQKENLDASMCVCINASMCV